MGGFSFSDRKNSVDFWTTYYLGLDERLRIKARINKAAQFHDSTTQEFLRTYWFLAIDDTYLALLLLKFVLTWR